MRQAWFSYKGVTLASFAKYDSYTHIAHKQSLIKTTQIIISIILKRHYQVLVKDEALHEENLTLFWHHRVNEHWKCCYGNTKF